MLRITTLFMVVLACSLACADSDIERELQSVVDNFHASNLAIPGVVLAVESQKIGMSWAGTAGVARVDESVGIDLRQPLRIASTTKTYVAAAVLRLVEQGALGLEDTLDEQLPNSQLDVLVADGYDPAQITIRQLLTHTSGIYDYADYEHQRFEKAVLADPHRRWTRMEQLQFAMDVGDPLGEPGERFAYSDTGYILLGEILERRSGLALAPALRSLLKFEELGLSSVWLESLEAEPENALPRIHQYWKDRDITDWDPSLDLYGGGGLVSNMPDLARFFAALLEGRIFEKPGTLDSMMSRGMTSLSRPTWMQEGKVGFVYGAGVFVSEYRGYTYYSHGGFWGIEGGYMPALGVAWGWAVTQEDSWQIRDSLRNAMLDVLIDNLDRPDQ